MDYIEGTRLPWQWIDQDVELPELKVGGDAAVVRWAESGKDRPSRDHQGRTQATSDRYPLRSPEHRGTSLRCQLPCCIRVAGRCVLGRCAKEEANIP